MSLWTLVRIVAGLVALAAVGFTALLVRHVRYEPMGGIFSELVPVSIEAKPLVALPQPNAELPEIDPGAKVFEKARELIAIGDLVSARDKLRTVVSIYPRSKAAPEARRIVGEMNLDEVLSAGHMDGKSVHQVKRGDSFLAIAGKHRTSLDMIMHLNGLLDLNSLHPGDELVVMPLDFRLVVETGKKTLSLWDGGKFVKEYLLKGMEGAPAGDLKTVIEGKSGVVGDKRMAPSMAGYRGSRKMLTTAKPPFVIAALPEEINEDEGGLGRGFYLAPEDVEELSLLIRPGNEVEIRSSAR